MKARTKSGNRRYLDQYVSSRASADMQALGLFPNAKEVTESFGALCAARQHSGWTEDDPVTVICPGDGKSPRTGATFAFFTPWTVWSVDPAVDPQASRWMRVHRLSVLPLPVEDIDPIEADLALVVAVHSHADLNAAIGKVRAREVRVIAIPCCVEQTWGNRPWMAYRDSAIWSDKNEVRVWR